MKTIRPELLLHPNVPKPLHGMSPRELKGKDWWDSVRVQVYKNASYRCQCCGVEQKNAMFHKWLEAHETYEYDYKNGVATVKEIVALCHACHCYIHSGLLRVNYNSGKISPEKYFTILNHGDALLKKHNVKPAEPPEEVAEWSKWKIVINGEEFPTKWKSYEHWKQYYNR